jgi:hypothetical protein
MIAFVLFIIVHITMVIVERFPDNMGNIFLGKGTSLGIAIGIFALFVLDQDSNIQDQMLLLSLELMVIRLIQKNTTTF